MVKVIGLLLLNLLQNDRKEKEGFRRVFNFFVLAYVVWSD